MNQKTEQGQPAPVEASRRPDGTEGMRIKRHWAPKKEHSSEQAVDTPLQPCEKIVTKVHEITIRTIVINQIGL